jgi:hypothetical protein
MVRKVLYPAVFVLTCLMTASAFGSGWAFIGVDTVDPDLGWPSDGRLFMDPLAAENPGGLVQTGALVQFIVDVEGDGFDDPLSFFDVDHTGKIEVGPELDAVTAWVRAGADPAAIGDDRILMSPTWSGTTTLYSPGVVYEYPGDPGYEITGNITGQNFGWRAWSLTREELANFCKEIGKEIWYTEGTEKGSYEYAGMPYDGWWVGAPSGSQPDYWTFTGSIGFEVYMHDMTGDPFYRSANILDTKLAECVPEPSTMLLIGGSALLLVLRRKK